MDAAQRKQALRGSMAARRRALPAAAGTAAGEAVARHLVACPAFERAPRVALYAAVPGELPTTALAVAARERGKLLLWPRVTAAEALEFAACPAPEELVPGRHGVRVPPGDRPAAELGEADLVVVPGLAFDRFGGRLGRGGGHYDRAFPPGGSGDPVLVGVGFAFQVVEAVPREAHDRMLDLLATEAGVLACAGDPR